MKHIILACVLIIVLLLSACETAPEKNTTTAVPLSTQTDLISTTTSRKTEPVTTEQIETVAESSSLSSTTSPSASQYTLADLAKILEDGLNSQDNKLLYVAEGTDDSLILSSTIEGMDDSIELIKSNFTEYGYMWDQITAAGLSQDLHSAVKSVAEAGGYPNATIILNIVSDKDHDVIYATMTNGEITYDALNELRESMDKPEKDPKVQNNGEIEWHNEGMYKVGYDLEPGEYCVKQNTKYSGYFCVSSDANGDDILSNKSFSGYYFITVEEGQYVEIKRAVFASAVDITLETDTSDFDEGMYRVGIDIPAGEYLLTNNSKYSSYVCIFSDSSVSQKTISNSTFKETKYVTVSEGQYLYINRCTAKIVE